jgi:hypothetical protein
MRETENGAVTGRRVDWATTRPAALSHAQIETIAALMVHIEEPLNPLRILRDEVYPRLRPPCRAPEGLYRARRRDRAAEQAVSQVSEETRREILRRWAIDCKLLSRARPDEPAEWVLCWAAIAEHRPDVWPTRRWWSLTNHAERQDDTELSEPDPLPPAVPSAAHRRIAAILASTTRADAERHAIHLVDLLWGRPIASPPPADASPKRRGPHKTHADAEYLALALCKLSRDQIAARLHKEPQTVSVYLARAAKVADILRPSLRS